MLFSVCVYPAMALHWSGAAAWGWGYRWRGSVWAASLTARAGATGRTRTANTDGKSSLRETEGGTIQCDTLLHHSVISYCACTCAHTQTFIRGGVRVERHFLGCLLGAVLPSYLLWGQTLWFTASHPVQGQRSHIGSATGTETEAQCVCVRMCVHLLWWLFTQQITNKQLALSCYYSQHKLPDGSDRL